MIIYVKLHHKNKIVLSPIKRNKKWKIKRKKRYMKLTLRNDKQKDKQEERLFFLCILMFCVCIMKDPPCTRAFTSWLYDCINITFANVKYDNMFFFVESINCSELNRFSH